MDAILHEFGTHSTRVSNKIKWYEEELSSIISFAKKSYEYVNIFEKMYILTLGCCILNVIMNIL